MPVIPQMASWTVKITVGTLYEIRNQKNTRTAIETREALANYLATDGSVSWHLDYIRRTGNE